VKCFFQVNKPIPIIIGASVMEQGKGPHVFRSWDTGVWGALVSVGDEITAVWVGIGELIGAGEAVDVGTAIGLACD
jgi:hypothetical protein